MAGLADLLTNLFQGGGGVSLGGGGGGGQWQKVVDLTGLTGKYQVTFNTSMFALLVEGRIMGAPADTGGEVISNDLLQIDEATYEQQHPEYIGAPIDHKSTRPDRLRVYTKTWTQAATEQGPRGDAGGRSRGKEPIGELSLGRRGFVVTRRGRTWGSRGGWFAWGRRCGRRRSRGGRW